MKFARIAFLSSALLLVSASQGTARQTASGLANSTVLIIRHGEKPETGTGLTPAGEARARAYVGYFKGYKVESRPFHVDYIFASKDSKSSWRERLTVEPLAKAMNLTPDLRFKNKEYQELADAMRAKHYGNDILICWHHGNIANMVNSLGGDAQKLIPGGKWPDTVFDWVIQLSYDGSGKLIADKTMRVKEDIKPAK